MCIRDSQDNLLTLRPALVGASPGGALEMLDSFSRHAARALALQQALSAEARRGGDAAAGLDRLLAERLLWPSAVPWAAAPPMPPAATAPAAAPAPAPAGEDDGGYFAGGADDDDDGGNTVALLARMEEERDELVLYLLKQLPEESLCALGEAEVGRPIRTAIAFAATSVCFGLRHERSRLASSASSSGATVGAEVASCSSRKSTCFSFGGSLSAVVALKTAVWISDMPAVSTLRLKLVNLLMVARNCAERREGEPSEARSRLASLGGRHS